MTAPTAAAILKDLDRRARQRQMETLAQMDGEHAAAVREALSVVSRGARIDVAMLLSDVRARLAAKAEAEAERMRANSPLKALQFRLSLISQGRLAELRDHLKDAEARGEATCDFGPGSAAAAIMARLDSISDNIAATTKTPVATATAELDEALDDIDGLDDDTPARKRHRVARVRSRRTDPTPEKPKPEPYRDNASWPRWIIDDGASRIEDVSFTGPL